MYQKHLILGIKPTKELYFECIWYQTSSKTIDYVVAAPRIKHRLRYLSKWSAVTSSSLSNLFIFYVGMNAFPSLDLICGLVKAVISTMMFYYTWRSNSEIATWCMSTYLMSFQVLWHAVWICSITVSTAACYQIRLPTWTQPECYKSTPGLGHCWSLVPQQQYIHETAFCPD